MTISVIISDSVRKQLDAVKEQTGLGISLLVRKMIEAHLAEGRPLTFPLKRFAAYAGIADETKP